jgi:hypothetical protein
MPEEITNYSDEDCWSDPDQLNHYFYLKDRYGFACAVNFAKRLIKQKEETSEDDETDWIQEDISEEEIWDSSEEEEHGPPVRKKHKIQSPIEEDTEGSATD